MAAPPLSVCIITLNAAQQLAACIRSASFAAEVLVVDSGSSDDTVALATSLGARVVQQSWLGFGPQKQFAVEQARHDWVLCLDADERVSPGLQASICKALERPTHQAYRFARANRFMGRYLRHGEGYPDWSLRLFHRQHARWSADTVHEKVLCTVPVASLSGDLLHDSAHDLDDYLNKQNRYTSLQAAQLVTRGQTIGLRHVVLSPLARFVKFYLLRAGFLDGLPGLVHILIGCQNSLLKYAKARELQTRALQAQDREVSDQED